MAVAANNIERIIMCPICLETMKTPILQCDGGHSMCGACILPNSITKCPQCLRPISSTRRNFTLEQMIENLAIDEMPDKCRFAESGCTLKLPREALHKHEAECKFRKFLCEGRRFAKWKCNWIGNYSELEKHFREEHRGKCLEYKMEMTQELKTSADSFDVRIIPFFNGSNYFYYKFYVDQRNQKIYWLFQLIGSQKEAGKYYYEFEIFNGVRKFKVTELCTSDGVDAKKTFELERCVVLSFQAAKNFLNDKNELAIKYRIMSIRKGTDSAANK